METSLLYKKFLECTAVSTDTRQIEKDSIFFALKGGNFNGNQFASEALAKGARYAVIDEKAFDKGDRYILVEDVLKALQQLANFHRQQFKNPVLAITGSNGKTTSKELIHAVLSKKYKTHATKGNLNNHIGVPLTLLSMKQDTEIAIIEMGANHQKEISAYCQIAEPTHGLITNIGKAHLEGFGGEEGVIKGKGELYDYLQENKGTIFINTNDPILKRIAKIPSQITYPNKGNYYSCELMDASPYIRFRAENEAEIHTQLVGAYNFLNIASALCIGKFFRVPENEANKAVSEYIPQNNRSQVVRKDSNIILLDAYNANPSSMGAAIENFSKMDAPGKILILGDMFELGDESQKEHKNLGKMIAGFSFDKVILCGKHMEHARQANDGLVYFPEKSALEKWLKENKFNNSTILIKGSRGMGLETLVDII